MFGIFGKILFGTWRRTRVTPPPVESSFVARIGDTTIGECSYPTHGRQAGVIISGASKTKCEGQFVARVGDTVQAACKHTAVILTGADKVVAEGASVARLGDSFGGGYYIGTITSAAEKTKAG